MADSRQADFKVGEVVQLNSGGPKMTVGQKQPHQGALGVYCQWFAGSKLESGFFAPEVLTRVTDDKKGAKST
jgi:uncharacterized protein YodC (DUF2158 family)